MAALFIGVTMAFPYGLAGLFESHIKPWWIRKSTERRKIKQRLIELENEGDLEATLACQADSASAIALPSKTDAAELVIRRSAP
jgi:urea transport system permease protein